MKTRLLASLLLLLNIAAGYAQDYSKMSPEVVNFIRQQSDGLHIMDDAAPKATHYFVRCKDNTVEPLCVKHAGDIHIIFAYPSELEQLSAYPAVEYIETSFQAPTATMDSAATIVSVHGAWEGDGLPQAFTGKGILVGNVDVSHEYSHPTFRSLEDGHCRIVRAWDFFANPQNEMSFTKFPLGYLYTDTTEMINAQRSLDSQYDNHGTHTAAGSAGSGWGTKYKGIAYDADLYLTAIPSSKTTERLNVPSNSATEALAFSNIFDYADSIGKPCVINFSMGAKEIATNGPKNLEEEFFSNIVGPGKIIVASAGNESEYYRNRITIDSDTHVAGGSIDYPEQKTILSGFAKGKAEMMVGILDPKNGNLYETFDINIFSREELADSLKKQNKSQLEYKWEFDSVEGYAYYTLEDSDRIGFDLFLINNNFEKKPYHYLVEIAGDDDTEMFLNSVKVNFFDATDMANYGDFDISELKGGQPGGSINTPGAYNCMVTVGASAYRTFYENLNGQVVPDSCGVDGVKADFSSVGPTLRGNMKPDVMAPGTNIISAENDFSFANMANLNKECSDYTEYDGKRYYFGGMSGTSMSTPIVTGIIALWLQADPTLTPDDVKEVIAKTATHYDESLSYPNNHYGYGEIDAYAGLLHILKLDGISGISHSVAKDVTILPTADGNVSITLASPANRNIGVRIYTPGGQLVKNAVIAAGNDNATVNLNGTTGIVAVQVDGYGSNLVRTR